jgi:hypothetical protein
MDKRLKRILTTTVLVLATATIAIAQPVKPAQPGKVTPVQKFKPPKVKTMWGRCVDSIRITRDEVTQLAGIPLRITDAQNKAYAISSYQLAYTRVTVTEDEETGKVLPATDMVSDRFTSTPLPPFWQETIRKRVQKGERFYFFDVIVKDAQGRLFFAPDLKVFVQ